MARSVQLPRIPTRLWKQHPFVATTMLLLLVGFTVWQQRAVPKDSPGGSASRSSPQTSITPKRDPSPTPTTYGVPPISTPTGVLPSPIGAAGVNAMVSRVVDGDTVELSSGEKVRYIGVDTPESVDPRRSVQCFGKEASELNRKLVEGKEVRLVADVEDRDRYGRLLRYVYVGDVFVNDSLILEGYAHVLTIPPNVGFVQQFKASEAQARAEKRGLWASC
jgi:endonuclease YncB( thermonuclease family)